MSTRPWTAIPIHDAGQPLEPLPGALVRLEPHPYVALRAPYGESGSPFRLRPEVNRRLLQAQQLLRQSQPHWALAIFDGWRPLAVQAFMVDHSIISSCRERGIDPGQASPEREAVVAEVGRFWAPPNADPAAPPPHSTGAAVDLTLADNEGEPLEMGSAIDAIGVVSEPDHFLRASQQCGDRQLQARYLLWHQRRSLLRDVMDQAGFVQHPNEWWHFSWGDQLWAWRRGEPAARFGRVR
ncbi:D-alanyl-D-alanine dipeptidase [Cyanobium sp. ATX 6A2]|uniref:M15 family metallopeptidase n=1 Tax=Cyanobium sp. ATX 6A2 TaxID=2823700 RepID=UPI0020CCD3E7|nr:M15 family metallopeptidase [Cyanobium sp. ATX 6A2]MCP9887150.1 D-alanyl-D-alanine dipeptidase [Cyanobium sp. ATX 6A2]